MRILLVEDEAQMAAALRAAFVRHDMVMDHAASLAEGAELAEAAAHDAILLDRRLPDGDGMKLLATWRGRGRVTPIIMLTAKAEIPDRIAGLEAGADDYLAKPFSFDELMARLRAVFRRPSLMQAPVARCGRLTFDFVNREARVGDIRIDLRRRELLAFECLIRRAGRMAPRSAMMEAVFGMDDEVQANALDAHVSRLRKKLAEAGAGVVINGVRGVGYVLREQS